MPFLKTPTQGKVGWEVSRRASIGLFNLSGVCERWGKEPKESLLEWLRILVLYLTLIKGARLLVSITCRFNSPVLAPENTGWVREGDDQGHNHQGLLYHHLNSTTVCPVPESSTATTE